MSQQLIGTPPGPVLHSKRVLLVISGGIAAYKSLELVRLLRQAGASVRAVLTRGGAEFITPLSVGAPPKGWMPPNASSS